MRLKLSIAVGTLVAALILSGNGCSKSEGRAPVFQVKGKATLEGVPMAGAMIGFHSLSPSATNGRRQLSPTSVVADDGTYALTSYVQADGAQPGEYVVTIFWPDQSSQVPDDGTTDDHERLPPDRLRRRFASPQSSPLRATVRSAGNQIDFAIQQHELNAAGMATPEFDTPELER